MTYKLLFLPLLFVSTLLLQRSYSQSITTSDKAVFYNFTVIKCNDTGCRVPFAVVLDNVHTVNGSFKGLNSRIAPIIDVNDFLFTVYNKKTGAKEWETVVPNPVETNVEYDGHDHGHQDATDESGSTLKRKTVNLDSGTVAIRLPYAQDQCSIRVSYIAGPDQIIELATF
jgi:hypothetical protein